MQYGASTGCLIQGNIKNAGSKLVSQYIFECNSVRLPILYQCEFDISRLPLLHIIQTTQDRKVHV